MRFSNESELPPQLLLVRRAATSESEIVCSDDKDHSVSRTYRGRRNVMRWYRNSLRSVLRARPQCRPKGVPRFSCLLHAGCK